MRYLRLGAAARASVFQRRLDEPREERVRAVRPRAELRVVLGAEVERMAFELADLDEPAVGRQSREAHAVIAEELAVRVVELPAVAMPLENDGLLVRAVRERPLR